MHLVLLAAFITAFLAPLLKKLVGWRVAWLLALLPAFLFFYFTTFLTEVLAGNVIFQSMDWVPQLNLNLDFAVDGLSLLFALLISSFGILILLYSGEYFQEQKKTGRFYLYLLLFMSAMLGVVLADNLLLLFVFWELTSISSYLLVGFKNESEAARNAALKALLVTSMGGLSLLAGLVILGLDAGTFSVSQLVLSDYDPAKSYLFPPILIFILIGVATKSAQFPFHFWLPAAMEAPTPVSAYLHSATMVKAGIYLICRLSPVFSHTDEWRFSLLVLGGVTMLLGAIQAVRKTDLKAILAYSTISSLGMLVLLIGLGTDYAIKAALIFLIGHALYKGALFLVAGTIDHATGTRDIRKLGGLVHKMPIIMVAAVLASLSMAGVIPFFGFLAKEAVYEAALNSTIATITIVAMVVAASTLNVTVACMLSYEIFFGKPTLVTEKAHKPGYFLAVPPLILASIGLIIGLVPAITAQPLLGRSIYSVLQKDLPVKLQLWHGFNLVLILSLLTILAGILLFFFKKQFRNTSEKNYLLNRIGPDALYEICLSGLKKSAYYITRLLQNGYLRSYVSVVLLTFICLILYTILHYRLELNIFDKMSRLYDVVIYELVTILIIISGLIYLHFTKSRLTSIATMGLIGYSTALIFLYFGAPDVAITQFLIETLTVVLFVLIIHKLPSFKLKDRQKIKYKYLVLATLFGSTITFVLLLVKQYPHQSVLKEYFGKTGLLLGKGHNIVNVILVDYRALDTLGEITVLGITALGITALLKLKLNEKEGK